ncbi:unnamed protein product [Closterium sp. NIES-64]|nr:unnamed protein product [Closterium sp. NIES-64]
MRSRIHFFLEFPFTIGCQTCAGLFPPLPGTPTPPSPSSPTAPLLPLPRPFVPSAGRVGAWVSNCTTDIGATRGKFLLAVFKDESSGTPVYNLYFDADLDEYSGTAPDTINIVQGAACDSTATAALTLTLPSTGWTTQTRGGRGGSHTELRVTGTVEGADATVVEALLAGVPNATVTQNVFTKVINGAKQGFQNAFGGRRRRGRELAGNSAGKLTQQFLKRQRQRLATTGNSWSAALTGNFGKCGGSVAGGVATGLTVTAMVLVALVAVVAVVAVVVAIRVML